MPKAKVKTNKKQIEDLGHCQYLVYRVSDKLHALGFLLENYSTEDGAVADFYGLGLELQDISRDLKIIGEKLDCAYYSA